jgi:hypothetical protein
MRFEGGGMNRLMAEVKTIEGTLHNVVVPDDDGKTTPIKIQNYMGKELPHKADHISIGAIRFFFPHVVWIRIYREGESA